jgi:hypothetical protein
MNSLSGELVILKWTDEADSHVAPWLARARVQMPDAHANRQREWALGRGALQAALHRKGYELKPEKSEFIGFQELSESSLWRFSLSHTNGWGGLFQKLAQCRH